MFFPPGEDGPTYGAANGRTADDVNAYTGGWTRTNTTRILWVNGQFDPWRFATVSSDSRPGGPLESTPEAPVILIPDGIHCADILTGIGLEDPRVAEIQQNEVATIKRWVDEFYQ